MRLPPQQIGWTQLQRSVKGLRIGLWLEPAGGWAIDPEVRSAIEAAARVFEQAGAVVEPIADWTTPDMRLGVAHFFTMHCHVDLTDMPPERAALAADCIQSAARYAEGLSAQETFRAFARLQQMRAATVAATEPYDFVLSPVSWCLPFAADAIHSGRDTWHRDTHFTAVFNHSNQPAASIPCGHSRDGLPIGLQISGRLFDDLGVLQMAAFYESARPAQTPWPQPPA